MGVREERGMRGEKRGDERREKTRIATMKNF